MQQRRQKRWANKAERIRGKMQIDSYDKIHNLPKNVTY